MKKVLLVLGIVGMFVMPMMPAKGVSIPHPTQHGDLIFYEGRGWWDMIGKDHVSIWDKYKDKIIEADPYYDVWGNKQAPWGGKLKNYYPWYRPCLKYLTYRSYTNPGTTWGWVEEQSLEHDTIQHPDRPYEKLWYYHVIGGDAYTAVNIFARSKIHHPFDYFSAWPVGKNSKQVDESAGEYMWYKLHKYNLGKGYYCSELVWAAWKKGGVDLDSNDNNRVTPQEIINENNNTQIRYYKTITIPP